METAQLILEYIQALIWPGIVIVGILIFRKPLVAIFSRLKAAGFPGGVSFDFEKDIRNAEDLSREVSTSESRRESGARPNIPLTEANARMLSLGLQPSPSGLDLTYYRNLAEQDPNVALAGLRMEVEGMARNLAKGFNVPVAQRDSAGALLRKLSSQGAITIEQFQLTQKIVRLCNAAVHGRTVSREEANSVIDVAMVLADQYIVWLSWGFPDDWKPSAQGE